jgi:hypothetical protein
VLPVMFDQLPSIVDTFSALLQQRVVPARCGSRNTSGLAHEPKRHAHEFVRDENEIELDAELSDDDDDDDDDEFLTERARTTKSGKGTCRTRRDEPDANLGHPDATSTQPPHLSFYHH